MIAATINAAPEHGREINSTVDSIMHISTITRLGAATCLFFTLQANALTINGVNYKQFTGSGTTCPSGSKVYVYKKTKYCKAYRARISWNIPTRRTNGKALAMSELKGYEVYWTRSSDNARGTIRVSSNAQISTLFDVYTPSTYYFAISAIDTKGLKSPLSTLAQAKLGK